MQQDDNAPDLTVIATGYREMSDAEIIEVARGYDGLIEPVQALVRAEFARRGLEPPLVEGGPDVEMRKLVTVERFLNLTEASLAQGLLESAGIESFLRDTNIVRNDWFYSNAMGGIRLEVDEKDLEAARELLAQPSPDHLAEEDSSAGS